MGLPRTLVWHGMYVMNVANISPTNPAMTKEAVMGKQQNDDVETTTAVQ